MSANVRRWPLLVIAAPAAVAIWSGWVGLGALCGFGDVEPLPGILHLHIDTALTLPLGIESYAALALGCWLRSGRDGRARRFARGSALGALVLGMLGQISFHLLAARHATRAPDVVVVLVACLPVVVLGCAVALIHLLSETAPEAEHATGKLADLGAHLADALAALAAEIRTPLTVPNDAPGDVPPGPIRRPRSPRPGTPARRTRTQPQAAPRKRNRTVPVTADECERVFMSELASGAVPSIRQIRGRLHVGQDKAREFRVHLESVSVRT